MRCENGVWRFYLHAPGDPRLAQAAYFALAVGPDPKPPLPVFVNGRAPRHDNPWPRFRKLDPPDFVAMFGPGAIGVTGLMPVPVGLPGAAGVEVLLCLRVAETLAKELKRVGLVRLRVTGGHRVTPFGPIGFLVFWVPAPRSKSQPWTGFSFPINPFVAKEVELWRILAAQTFWHVYLMGKNDRLHDEYDLENSHDLDVTLDAIEAARGAAPMTDAARARAWFDEHCSVSQLLGASTAN
jgi:hypothetical protein